MQKNELDATKTRKVDLIFRKRRGDKKYDELIRGEKKDILLYAEYIADFIDAEFFSMD